MAGIFTLQLCQENLTVATRMSESGSGYKSKLAFGGELRVQLLLPSLLAPGKKNQTG